MALKKTTHEHKHNHCKHDRLKFCNHCQKPYCVSCGQEWGGFTYTPFYQVTTDTLTLPNTTPAPLPNTWPTITCSNSSLDAVGGNAAKVSFETCNHIGKA